MDGGCFCGTVRYRLAGPPIFVNGCHCRKCQKQTGSAFAVNAMIERDRVAVVAGADALAIENGETRCARCRTFLWATVAHMFGDGILFLRGGTLDESERLEPDAHFFVRSKHSWIRLPDGVRAFATLPGDGDPPLLDAVQAGRVAAATG